MRQTSIHPFEIQSVDNEEGNDRHHHTTEANTDTPSSFHHEQFEDNDVNSLQSVPEILNREGNFSFIEPCNLQHGHSTTSFLFLILISASSTLSFTLSLYSIHLILNLTMRMYFCFPVVFFQSIEKLFVLQVTKRIGIIHSSNNNSSHSNSNLNQFRHEKRGKYQNLQLDEGENAGLSHKHLNDNSLVFTFVSPFKLHNADASIHWWKVIQVVGELITIIFFGICYFHIIPKLTHVVSSLLEDIDGEVSSDWYDENKDLERLIIISKSVGVLYLIVVSLAIAALLLTKRDDKEWQTGVQRQSKQQDPKNWIEYEKCNESESSQNVLIHDNNEQNFNPNIDGDNGYNDHNKNIKWTMGSESFSPFYRWKISPFMKYCRIITTVWFIISIVILLLSISSAWIFLINHKVSAESRIGPNCDPIDTTECLLPFPSSFFTTEDDTTQTGIRVDIKQDAMGTMYRGWNNPKHPTALNEMDGFSTSGPILFYLNGLKEGNGKGTKRLAGPEEIHLSITDQSMTLLFDIDSKVLIPHFAEIDYMDDDNPTVIVQPAKGLEHNRRYAVAVIDATDKFGKKLPVSNHLKLLLRLDSDLSERERKRGYFYVNEVVASLQEAAPFFDSSTQTIQLLFDFHTMSEESQLGKTRAIIRATLKQLEAEEWEWNESNVRLIKVINNNCAINDEVTRRIIHGSIDLPHFLKDPTTRITELDIEALEKEQPNGLFTVKFVTSIPCSLESGSKPLTSVVDFGHGFLHSRVEIIQPENNFFQRMSHDHGYVMISSNWRGMSIFDIPFAVKLLVGDPKVLVSVQHNIMQGFAFKAGITHFCRNGLLNMDFMKFDEIPIKQSKENPPRMIFYGISQGGILGSGYSTLLGPTKLLDGAALVSAGTPFSTIMSRSIIFPKYHKLMLLNLVQNRHARIFMSMMQMYYDSIEAGGILSSTKPEERVKTLMQSGLGDSIVTTISTTILARSYDASIFPSNPKAVFGLPTLSPDENTNSQCVFTEILYEEELKTLPTTNVCGSFNPVHMCVHSDPYAIGQLTQFINTGNFVDVCPPNGCRRETSWGRWYDDFCR